MDSLQFKLSDIESMDLEKCEHSLMFVRYMALREEDKNMKLKYNKFASKLDHRINELKAQRLNEI